MGGYGSGRPGSGKPLKDTASTIDFARMLRMGTARDGAWTSGTMHWAWGNGSNAGSVSYSCDMTYPRAAILTLSYRQCRRGEEWQDRKQVIRLVYTVPPYGGRRWWMICPVRGNRVGKLYLPDGDGIFAGRKAWRLAYRSQRGTRLDRLQGQRDKLLRRLGSGDYPVRPKGMWQRTYDRLLDRYLALDAAADEEWTIGALRLLARLGADIRQGN